MFWTIFSFPNFQIIINAITDALFYPLFFKTLERITIYINVLLGIQNDKLGVDGNGKMWNT
jgi:hypothetical protein